VISWVVLRRRAILISDLKESAYSKIHVWLNEEVRSELAAPMVSGDRVIGVICLESLESKSFVPSDVRSLWYAANRAAVACRFYEQVSISTRLLEVCSLATAEHSEKNILNELAAITREHLDAAFCDIWKYDADSHALGMAGQAGASYLDFEPGIREDGWSEFVRSSGRPVWIFKVSRTNFRVLVENDGIWKEQTPGSKCPKSMNSKALGQAVRCELGLPILSDGECVGVAWVKYSKNIEEPSTDFMRLAKGFAAQVALVLGVVRNRIQLEHRRVVEETIREHLVGVLDLSAIERIEGYCSSIPGGGILGGDYCRGISISKQRVGILLLDGEGHGTRGSLNMLPLAGGFAALGEFASATYVMEKMIRIARDVGVRGTALYCIFTEIGENLYVSATCAGHLPIILLRYVGGIIEHKNIPNLHSSARGAQLWGFIASPVTEEVVDLRSGDLLIGYTDGVNEALTRAEISALGEKALEMSESPTDLVEAIIGKVMELRKIDGQADDVTVFVIRVK
jgi:GAF domain-containing protein